MPPLSNGRHELFAAELALGRTADDAYVAAGYVPNRGNAARLKANEGVQARVAELQAAAAKQTEASIAGVLSELWSIATADATELVEYRRGACGDCWGEPPAPSEMLEPQAHGGALRRASGVFLSYDPQRDRAPNADCEVCGGEGVGRAFIADTRKLSPAARRLYAGVKVTKDGIEVRMHDKLAALTKVGQHLGMFTKVVELGNKDGKPLQVTRIELFPVEPSGEPGDDSPD